MAATATLYDSYHQQVMSGGIDWSADTFKVALCTSSYTPNRATHSSFSDVTNECAATGGYVAGGFEITSGTVTLDTTGHRAYFDGDDITIDPATITARYAVLYKSTGVAGTSSLIGWIDFGADQSASNGPFKIQWSASGIFESK